MTIADAPSSGAPADPALYDGTGLVIQRHSEISHENLRPDRWGAVAFSTMGYNNATFTEQDENAEENLDQCTIDIGHRTEEAEGEIAGFSDAFLSYDNRKVQKASVTNSFIIQPENTNKRTQSDNCPSTTACTSLYTSTTTQLQVDEYRIQYPSVESPRHTLQSPLYHTPASPLAETPTPESWQQRLASCSLTSGSHHALGTVTAALGALLARCFGCRRGKDTVPSWWNKREGNQAGAWFDCRQVPSNCNFSYSNPIGVTCDENLPTITSEISRPDPSVETERSDPTDVHNFSSDETLIARSSYTACSNDVSDVFADIELHSEDVQTCTSQSHEKTSFATHVSFANQIEEYHKHRETDIERCEGNLVNYFEGNENVCNASSEVEHSSFIECEEFPECTKHLLDSTSKLSTPETTDHCKEIFEEYSGGFDNSVIFSDDVWEDTELEEAFGIYNLNAFYSYGSTAPIVLNSNSSKSVTEKYEEVFPVKKPRTSLSPLHSRYVNQDSTVSAQIAITENAPICDQRKWVSRNELYNIVEQFLIIEDDGTYSEMFKVYKNSLSCDNYFVYKNKRITKLLLFDLVNEQRLLCNLSYSSSGPCTGAIHHECIKKKVFHVLDAAVPTLKTHRKLKRNMSNVNKHGNDKLVENLVVETLRHEERSWINYEKEEFERKISLCDEILNDLIIDTTALFNSIILRKNTASGEGCNS